MALPGVKVGPLDPDATSQFGQVSAHNSARQLIRLHRQMHPAHLVRVLALPLDPERTKGIDLEEVAAHVDGLERENGDPVLPEGATVVGAQVRGSRDRQQVLTFTYETESGRTGKWFAPYDAEALPQSHEAGSEFVRVREMRDRGVVAFDESGTENAILRNQTRALRRENEALRAAAEGRSGRDESDVEETERADAEASVDTRSSTALAEEVEQLRRERQEMAARLAELEPLAEQLVQERDQRSAEREREVPTDDVASADEPVEGYDRMNATDVCNLLKSADTDNETRERVLEYERTHANRRTVVAAGEQSLGSGAANG